MGRRKKSPRQPPRKSVALAASVVDKLPPDLDSLETTSQVNVSLEAPAASPAIDKGSAAHEGEIDAGIAMLPLSDVSPGAQRRSPSPAGQMNSCPETTPNILPQSGSRTPAIVLANPVPTQTSFLQDYDAFPALRPSTSAPTATAPQAAQSPAVWAASPAAVPAIRAAPPAAELGKKPAGKIFSWAERVSRTSRTLRKRVDGYKLSSGEDCVTIPNAVITRNKKAWASFILGQFHGTLPSMGALHAILNGIWSNKARDITISRAGSQSVLIKVPNAATRKRILEQGIWHIEGQSMFVGAWEPGLKAEIPELKEVPVWIDFKGVPPHFFSAEGMEYIASLVGEPLFLHPRTEAMINLEVARVFTLVDLKKPLPDTVYVMFESGEKHKIDVSCQWLPPLCTHCNQYGHSLRRCPTAPIKCTTCKSTTHETHDCNRSKLNVRSRNGQRNTNNMQRQSSKIETGNHEIGNHGSVDARGDLSQACEASLPPQPRTSKIKVATPAPVDSQDNQDVADMVPIQDVINVNKQVDDAPPKKDVQAKNDLHASTRTLRIKEPQALNASIRKPNRVIGKGKSKVLRNVESTNSTSDEDSYVDSDVDIHTVLKNLPASIIKRTRRQGKHSKGRDLLENSFY